ncbi:hypothetical protein L7F22_060971 [Adiantum nelumboides]|nr:hypothetical protein [Adiantum nelumboides]
MQIFGANLQDRWPLTVRAAAHVGAVVVIILGLFCECGLAVVYVPEEKPVPAIFGFGDSLLDAGNNNGLRTLAKANHPPYGQDFPTRTATGRFANGYMILDLIALKLGLPLTPIHSDPSTKGVNLLHGVNFASAGSGIQSYVGRELGKVASLDAQIQQFAQVKEEIIATIGVNATSFLIKKSLFYIVTGTNDWLLYTGTPIGLKFYTEPQYRDLLITKFILQIKELYNLGARRVAVVGLGAFGCCPGQMSFNKALNGTCVQSLNEVAKDFNDHWKPQFLALSSSLPGSYFTFEDAYTALLTVRNNPSDYGYNIVDRACCSIDKYQLFPFCLKGFPSCENVEDHLFWDAHHPTSRFQAQFLDLVWNNGPPYSYPCSGKQFLSGLRD